VMGWSIIKII